MSREKALWERAVALLGEARHQEALECMLALEKSLPGNLPLLSNIGVLHRDLGNVDEAEQYFRRVLAAAPDDPAAHFNRALALLRGGRWREGFAEYEWRWQLPQFAPQRRPFEQPLWGGEPLAGKRILLWGEQGAGDIIQFARYAPLVRQAGGDVILEVLPHLERLC